MVIVFYTSVLHSTANFSSEEAFVSTFDALATDSISSSLRVHHQHMVHVACALCTHVHLLACSQKIHEV